ncbi:MAG: protein kinase [Oscillatoria sp. PMC 1068.18]|nr:protein kinase [Oscillatoria sp. PMC 1076.18]MEC4987135.1 protein kinase [Oscillatoria sp. PMC 1068.18]
MSDATSKQRPYPRITMTTLAGYHLGKTLYQSRRTFVDRDTRLSDCLPVVIKFLRHEYPSFSQLLQFRNQYTIAINLDLPGIVKPLALLTHGNGYALVMPDEGYVSLAKYPKEKLSLFDFLTVGIQLAEILQQLYQNRVIDFDDYP